MENVAAFGGPCPSSLSGAVSANLFLTLVNTLLTTKCSISSRNDYPPDYSSQLKDEDEFDFIVIGSGSAGSVVANKLSENPNWKILVLEAGSYPSSDTEVPSLAFSLQKTSEDWQYVTEPDGNSCLGLKKNRSSWPRGKVLGGSSTINCNVYVRGNRKDYDGWAKAGNPGWDYDSVLKIYKELEDLQAEDLKKSTQFGRKGYLPLNVYHSKEPIRQALMASARELGYPTVLEEQSLGYFDSLQTIEKGVRANAAKSFLGKVKERSNLKVALNSFVEKILFNDQKTVKGIEINTNNRIITVKARKEVILSAGAINSPQILMLSGIGPKSHLESLGIDVVQDLPVGKNLQDHLMFVGLYVAFQEPVPFKSNPLDDLYKYFAYRKGPLGEIGITNLLGFINTRNNSAYPDIQMLHIVFEQNDNYVLKVFPYALGLRDEIVALEQEVNKRSKTLTILPTLLNPKSHGSILLRSKNPMDKPLIFANYLQDPEDIETMLRGIKCALNQLETESFKEYNPEVIDLKIPGCEKFEFKSDDYYRCALKQVSTTVFHPTGTCKMGPSHDPTAVVDSRLKVHGINNLRVIDASIMPTITSANTHAPSVMIGGKGAAMIKEDWGHSHSEL